MTNDNGHDTTLPSKPNTDRVSVGINIARNPAIWAGKSVRGYRKLTPQEDHIDGIKVIRQVSVGTYRETNLTLNGDDLLVFMAIYGRWETHGCDMEKRTLVSTLANTTRPLLLSGPGKKATRRLGERDYSKLRMCIDKLASVGITFDEAWEGPGGWETKTVTLLKRAKVFNRSENLERGGKFFEFTELEMNEDICRDIANGKIKLFYADQIYSLRAEAARLIYLRLEYIGGIVAMPFRRELLPFAKELMIDVGTDGKIMRNKLIIKKVKRACADLKGKMLTHGVITDCRVEREHIGGQFKWYFICDIKKVITTRPKRTKRGTVYVTQVVPDRSDLQTNATKSKDDELMDRYIELSEGDKKKIDARAAEIHRGKFNGMGTGIFAKLESLREFFGLDTLYKEVESLKLKTGADLIARAPAGRPYLGKAERQIIFSFLSALQKIALLKGPIRPN